MPLLRSQRGIALVLTVGILVLLSVTGAGMISLVVRLQAYGSARIDHVTARLLALSGVDYGSARLAENPFPMVPATAGNQSDDWTCRDDPEVPLEKSLNPSYAQTEPYTDLGGNGRYDPSVDTSPTDWNRNGRFDAWSGRLRHGGSDNATFRLNISSEETRINVNYGILSSRDQNGNGKPDYNEIGRTSVDPQSRLAQTYYQNGRVADLLDALGKMLGASSGLGRRILANRPLGGYGSHGAVLSGLPPADRDKVGKWLTVSTWPVDDLRFEQGNAWDERADHRYLLVFPSAPRTLLRLVARGLRLWGAPFFGITDDEADRVADFLLEERGAATPYRLRSRLWERKDAVFDPVMWRTYPSGSALETPSFWIPGNITPDYVREIKAEGVATSFSPEWGLIHFGYGYDPINNPSPNNGLVPHPYHLFELSFVPSGVFRLESASSCGKGGYGGAISTAQALFEPVRTLSARTQVDFENPLGFKRYPNGVTMHGKPERDRTHTFPLVWDPCPDMASVRPDVRGRPKPADGIYEVLDSRQGTVRAADRSEGLRGDELFYVPGWQRGQPLLEEYLPPADLSEGFRDLAGGVPFRVVGADRPEDSEEVNVPLISGHPAPDRVLTDPDGVDGGYIWEDGSFPLLGIDATVPRGSIEHEIITVVNDIRGQRQWNPMRVTCGLSWRQEYGQSTDELAEPTGSYGAGWHFVVFTFDKEQGVQGYVDGIPDPGLRCDFHALAYDPASASIWQPFGEIDEIRFFGDVLGAGTIQARSRVPRYWTREENSGNGRLNRPPEFVSPLYRFPGAARIVGGRWDGFVPEGIQTWTEAWNRRHPDDPRKVFEVELICYGDPDGKNEIARLKLSEDGGYRRFEGAGVVSMRYRVAVDASAVGSFSDADLEKRYPRLVDSPVFDNIFVQFQSTEYLQWHAQ